jgi:uracil-DNA glycosylase family 4
MFRKDDDGDLVIKEFPLEYLIQSTDEDLVAIYYSLNAQLAHIAKEGSQVVEIMNHRDMDVPGDGLISRLLKELPGDKEPISKAPDPVTDPDPIVIDIAKTEVAPEGPQGALCAFVSASPNDVDAIRGRPLVGPQGRTLKARYLDKLGLKRSECFIMDMVPVLLKDEAGRPREPTPDEIEHWRSWFELKLKQAAPAQIIALGKVARDGLGDLADEWMPHPMAIMIHGESAEITRKMTRIKKFLAENLVRVKLRVDLLKAADGEKRLVYGVVAEPDTEDSHGDTISADVIEQAAHRFLVESRVAGDQHGKRAPAEVVESYIAQSELDIEGQTVPEGTWIIGMKVYDDEFWNRVKEGEFTGFSLGGFAKRVAA